MYLVTGATGNVGSEVVDQLLAQGRSVGVLTREAGRVARWGGRVEVLVGSFQQPQVFPAALAGVEGLFLMNRTLDVPALSRLLGAARSASTPRIVFLSTLAVGSPRSEIGRMHFEQEEALRASSLPTICLRPGGFMSNAYQWIPGIRSEGTVYNAMGTGRFAPIAPADIAAIAVKSLTQTAVNEMAVELTGGELITVPEQVDVLSAVTGRRLRCIDIDIDTAVQNMVRAGLPAPIAAAVGQSFEAVGRGDGAQCLDTVERLLGRKPMTFVAWARERAAQFA